MYFGNIISSKKKDEIVRTWVFSLRCSICGTDNPDEHQFCSSCGKPISKPQPLMNTIPLELGRHPFLQLPKDRD